MTKRILLAERRPSTRSALRLLLEQEPQLEIVGEVDGAGDLLVRVVSAEPDLLLLDWAVADLLGSALMRALRAYCPQVRVIALSGRPEARWEALAAGVDAFVSKGEPPERLLETVRKFVE